MDDLLWDLDTSDLRYEAADKAILSRVFVAKLGE